MSAYAIFQIRITDPDAYKSYAARVPDTLARYGGRFVVRGGACDVLEGEWPERRIVVIEFPTRRHAHDWFESDEYAPLKALRRAASEGRGIVVDGFDA